MNQRDKLISLLEKADNEYGNYIAEIREDTYKTPRKTANEFYADFLLANGVIVPPMKLGQICFCPCDYRNMIDECRVSSITQKADGTFKIRLTNLRGKWVFEVTADKIGKTVFLSREEAEKDLAERSVE